MKVSFKDATATLLAALAAVVALAVVNGWGWPLLSGYRAGTITLGVIGVGMCALGSDYSTVRGLDPFVVVAGLLGVTVLGLVIAGLIWATATLLVWLAVTILVLWLVTTVRHMLARRGRSRPPRPRLESQREGVGSAGPFRVVKCRREFGVVSARAAYSVRWSTEPRFSQRA